MTVRQREIINKEYDVVVVGGGLSGVCAALACARNGAKTAIIQARPVFGGCASSEVRMHVCGASCHARKPNLAETGILEELLLDNKSRNHTFSFPLWDVCLWSKIYEQENLDFYLNTSMDEVEMNGENIKTVICRQTSTEKIYKFNAQIFIDATGNASLGYYSGAIFRYGAESKEEFNEPHAPKTPNKLTMGNTIMFTSKDTGEKSEFKKPTWAYDISENVLNGRPHGNATLDRGENGIVEEYNVDSGYWWNELGGVSEDIIGKTEEINIELYKSLFGIWDHIKNKGEHGAENYELQWVGAIPGIRESRRLEGDYLLNEHDVLSNRIFDDAVAYGGWPMDMHSPKGLWAPDIPTTHINHEGSYTIPYRCYYSKNVKNLMMAGRDISTTRMAFGSTRVMGTCAIGGQAVGTAAAIACKYKCSPKVVGEKHIKELQQTLLKDDCYIPGFKNQDELDLARKASITATSFLSDAEPIKVINGVSRNENGTNNCWISNGISKNGESIELRLEKPCKVSEIRCTFDPNLNSEIMITMTKRVQAKEVKHLPYELVKDYKITAKLGDSVVYEELVIDNIKRLAIHKIQNQPIVDSVILTVLSTYGDKNARVFEIRIY